MIQPGAAAWMASLVVMGSAGCLLYTDEINAPPSVSIEAATLTPFRSVPLQVTARTTDDQDAQPIVTWVEVQGRCPDGEVSPPSNLPRTGGAIYTLAVAGWEPVCLFVRAGDHHGAFSPWRHQQFTPTDRAPKAVLELSPPPSAAGTFPLYTKVMMSAVRSIDPDGDPLAYDWRIMGPQGALTPASCGDGMPPTVRCFVPRIDGRYAIQLDVTELVPSGFAGMSVPPETRVVDVLDDQPPCLEVADPPIYQDVVLIQPGTKRTFQVISVRDDGEPYPGPGENGQTLFYWWISRAGQSELGRTTLSGPTFEVGEGLFGNARPGDQFRVRVDVRDQVLDQKIGGNSRSFECEDAQGVCKDAAGCVHWATWRVQFHP